jgi:hypothetical protein
VVVAAVLRRAYEDDGEALSISGLDAGLSAGVPGVSTAGAWDSSPGVVGLELAAGE